MEKLEWLGEKISKISLFVLAQLTNVTDRRTDGRTDRHRVPAYTALMHTHRAVKMKAGVRKNDDFLQLWFE